MINDDAFDWMARLHNAERWYCENVCKNKNCEGHCPDDDLTDDELLMMYDARYGEKEA